MTGGYKMSKHTGMKKPTLMRKILAFCLCIYMSDVSPPFLTLQIYCLFRKVKCGMGR